MASACCAVITVTVLAGCSGAVSGSPQSANGADGADLVVADASVSDGSPSLGGNTNLSVTVRNTGATDAATTTLRYYRSTDGTISTADIEVGMTGIAKLSSGAHTDESVQLTAPSTPGAYYFGACVDPVADEADDTNNCSDAVPMTVGTAAALQGRPDLLVALPSASDGSPSGGARFTLSASVRNVGGGSSTATTLRYYRSADAAIAASDTEVGTAEIAELSASGSTTESAQLTAPSTPGAYYFGACVDPVADETDNTNNCSTSVPITVQEPDLVVGRPSVSNAGPAVGATFGLTATVKNDGTGSAAATTLRYYQSADETISTTDSEVGSAAVAGLTSSGSSSQSVDVAAPSTPGTYFYGVCVDPVADESDTTNNCSTAVSVTVQQTVTVTQGDPDLVVPAASVGDSAPAAGARFRLSATVRNDGDGDADATSLYYYRSTDATITDADTRVGSAAVVALAASGSTAQWVDLTAPSTPGTYYYGACAGAVSDETDTTNNCSAAVTVTVPQPPRPDLTVAQPSVTDGSPATGAPFTLSATVSNGGSGDSAATTLRYYRSTDATISATDTRVGTNQIAELAAAGSVGQSVDLTAPSTPGIYYYGACVVAVAGEADTTNNCSPSVTVTILQPDLVVGSPAVKPSDPEAGAQFTLSVTVENDGVGESDAATLRYYSSTDAAITTSDTQVGTDSVAGLAAAATSRQSVDLTAPSTPGTHYYGACVDAVTDESDTTNNCSPSVTVTILQSDLVVGSPAVNPSDPEAGAQFTLSVTVENDGEGESDAATLRYYSSTDAAITTSDTQVGTDSVAGLAAAATSRQSVDLTAPSTPGTHYYGACVDAVTDEADTTNNCSAPVTVTVPQPKPDLIVATPWVDDSSPEAGATFTLSATVENDGKGSATATTLRYYRSTDATIATTDNEVGTDSIGVLAADGTSDQSVDLTAPDSAGTYYYGACVDAVTDEADTTNNCSASVTVTVTVTVTETETETEQQDGPSVEISVEDEQQYAPVGDTVDLSVEVLDEEGDEIIGTTVTWSSSDPTIATVDSSGVMTAVGTGWATLTAAATVSGSSTQSLRRSSFAANSDKTVTGSVRMHVVEPVARIEIDPDSLSFNSVNARETLTATLYDADDNVMRPTYWGWRSANEEVATVRSAFFSSKISAYVQSVGEGSTTVTLSANGSATGTASVTLTLPTARVSVDPVSLTFEALGDTKTVTVKVFDENGDEDKDATFGSFAFSSPCCGDFGKVFDITKVDDGLEITAVGTGSGRITICSPSCFRPVDEADEEPAIADAVVLVTIYQEPASLTVSPDTASLAVDGTATLSAAIQDANGNDIRLAGGGQGGLVVYWETSDSAVATVEGVDATETGNNGATATVTGVAAGSATITGRWGGISVTGTATVTVTE